MLGTHFSTESFDCELCPANTINAGNTSGCVACSRTHYATTNNSAAGAGNTECRACAAGKIRQIEINGGLTCELCTVSLFVQADSQQCDHCVISDDYRCALETDYIDDCSDASNTHPRGNHACKCGCTHCSLYDLQGIDSTFQVFDGCKPGCKNNYKVRSVLTSTTSTSRTSSIPSISDTSFECVSNQDAMQQYPQVQFNNGLYKLSSINSSDWVPRLCFSFFSISVAQMLNTFHMKPCEYADMGAFRVQSTILAAYIVQAQELSDMNDFCRFCCQNGYQKRQSLTSPVEECVLSNSSCLNPTPQYTSQICPM